MRQKSTSALIKADLTVSKLASPVTKISPIGRSQHQAVSRAGAWLVMISILSSLLIPALAQAEILFRGYYKSPEVETFFERPSVQSFAQMDSELQMMAMSDMMSTPKAAGSPEQKVLQHYFSRLNAQDRAEVISTAFRLSVENGQLDLAKRYFEQGTQSDPSLVQKYICNALTDGGYGRAGDGFDANMLEGHTEQIGALLPIIAQVPNPNMATCEVLLENEDNPEDLLTRKMTIGDLVAKASPKFRQQLEGLARELSLAALRHNRQTSADLIQSYSACSPTQIIQFFNYQVYPAFSQMPKGGSQYAIYSHDSCTIDGIFKKIVSKQGTSYELTPSNGKLSYQKISIPFRTADELASILKTGFKK